MEQSESDFGLTDDDLDQPGLERTVSREMRDRSMSHMRSLLSSYYGMSSEQKDGGVDCRDINSNTFDSTMHVKEMLRNQNLHQLLERDDKLSHEIKSLDSDMQMLVYENYNKFITATDTIRTMKHNVGEVQSEMQTLQGSIDTISTLSDSISETLGPRREKIRKLLGVRRLLHRLEFIFELPLRLRRAIELKAYSQAVGYYTLVSEVLRKHQHVESFKAIHVEAEGIIRTLRENLRQRMSLTGLRPSEISELVSLLIELGDPVDQLRKQYLSWHTQRLIPTTHSFEVSSTAPEVIDGFVVALNEAFITGFMEVVREYSGIFLERESAAVKQFAKHTSSSEDGATEQSVDDCLQESRVALAEMARAVFGHYFAVLKPRLRDWRCFEEQLYSFTAEEADIPLSSTVSISESYSEEEEAESVAAESSTGVKPSIDKFRAALVLVYKDVGIAHVVVRNARLGDRSVELLESSIREQLAYAFNRVKFHLLQQLDLFVSESESVATPSIPQAIQSMNARLLRGMRRFFSNVVKVMVSIARELLPEVGESFPRLVLGLTQDVLQWLCGRILLICQCPSVELCQPGTYVISTAPRATPRAAAVTLPPLPSAKNAKQVLVLAGLLRECFTSTFSLMMTSLGRIFPASYSDLSVSGYAALGVDSFAQYGEKESSIPDPVQIFLPELLKKAERTSAALLYRSVRMHAASLTAVLRPYFFRETAMECCNWPSVTSVHPVFLELWRAVWTACLELEAALEEKLPIHTKSSLSANASLQSAPREVAAKRRESAVARIGGRFGLSAPPVMGREYGLRQDIERLFRQNDTAVEPTPMSFGVEWAVGECLRRLLKSVVEFIRLSTVNRNGYQQCQVDLFFLQELLPNILEDTRPLQGFFRESLRSAARRALDPVALDESRVDAFALPFLRDALAAMSSTSPEPESPGTTGVTSSGRRAASSTTTSRSSRRDSSSSSSDDDIEI